MSDSLYKYVNVVNPRTGRPVIDRRTGLPVSRLVAMTSEEAAAFEAERVAQQEQEQEPAP